MHMHTYKFYICLGEVLYAYKHLVLRQKQEISFPWFNMNNTSFQKSELKCLQENYIYNI